MYELIRKTKAAKDWTDKNGNSWQKKQLQYAIGCLYTILEWAKNYDPESSWETDIHILIADHTRYIDAIYSHWKDRL